MMQDFPNAHGHFGSVLDMLALRSQCFAGHVRTQVDKLFRSVLGSSCADIDMNNLISTMDKHRAVISGSVVLSMIYDGFTPKDIDWYVPKIYRDGFVHYFEERGYHVESFAKKNPHSLYDELRDVDRVDKLMKEGHPSMDIISSCTESPISAIMHFHSTVVMNFMTARSLYIAYPLHLTQRINLINLNATFHPRHIELNPVKFTAAYPGHDNLGMISVRMNVALQKYIERGYKLCREFTSPHKCFQSGLCPHTIQTTKDTHGILIIFDEEARKNVEKGDRELLETLLTVDCGDVTWCLGGPPCFPNTLPSAPFCNIYKVI